jgi:predicted nucleotidyltransferase
LQSRFAQLASGKSFSPAPERRARYNGNMAKKPPAPVRYRQPYRYASPDIPLSAIRRFARRIAERFKPEKIILFGSYAYGTPHEESDVDLMVIMPARNEIDQALRIEEAFEREFSRDIHVCTPTQLKRRLKEDDRDWFLYEVVTKGKVLYEAPHGRVGGKGRGGLAQRTRPGRSQAAAKGRGVLPLPADCGKVPQGAPAKSRRCRATNP